MGCCSSQRRRPGEVEMGRTASGAAKRSLPPVKLPPVPVPDPSKLQVPPRRVGSRGGAGEASEATQLSDPSTRPKDQPGSEEAGGRAAGERGGSQAASDASASGTSGLSDASDSQSPSSPSPPSATASPRGPPPAPPKTSPAKKPQAPRDAAPANEHRPSAKPQKTLRAAAGTEVEKRVGKKAGAAGKKGRGRAESDKATTAPLPKVSQGPWGDTSHTSCTEFRIMVPLSLAEFEKAQMHSVMEGSKKLTGAGSGVEVVKVEPFGAATANNPPEGLPGWAGVYTEKVYHLRPFVPAPIRALLSPELMRMEERAWNAFPLCKTLISNGKWAVEDCSVLIASLHVEGDEGRLSNALGLPPELLAIRHLRSLDICDDELIGGTASPNYSPDEDPKRLSTWDGRGPFRPAWPKAPGPRVCVYKVVACRLRWRFLESRLRHWALDKTYPTLFAKFHRLALCSYDRWSRLSLAQLRALDREAQLLLRRQLLDKTHRKSSLTLQG